PRPGRTRVGRRAAVGGGLRPPRRLHPSRVRAPVAAGGAPMIALVALLFAAQEAAAGEVRLPPRPEVTRAAPARGEATYTVRGRDCAAADFLLALAPAASLVLDADSRAQAALVETIVTVDLHDRPANETLELLAAAAGVDVSIEGNAARFEG